MSLDLYAKVEPYLDFSNEVAALHNAFLQQIITKELNNVLDVGCGQGHFLKNLIINGIECFGIDLSAQQISICEANGLPAKSIDLCELDKNFDCLTAIFDVINYIPPTSLKQFFQCAYDRLNDEGYFIFDINTLFGFDEVAQGTLTIDLEDSFIAIDAVFEKNQLETSITLFEKQKDLYSKEQSSIVQYYHETSILKDMLEQIGFQIESIDDFHLHCDENADKQILICKKLITK